MSVPFAWETSTNPPETVASCQNRQSSGGERVYVLMKEQDLRSVPSQQARVECRGLPRNRIEIREAKRRVPAVECIVGRPRTVFIVSNKPEFALRVLASEMVDAAVKHRLFRPFGTGEFQCAADTNFTAFTLLQSSYQGGRLDLAFWQTINNGTAVRDALRLPNDAMLAVRQVEPVEDSK